MNCRFHFSNILFKEWELVDVRMLTKEDAGNTSVEKLNICGKKLR